MVQIDYCQPPTEFDWEPAAIVENYCGEFPQKTVDDWLSGISPKWYPKDTQSAAQPTLSERFLQHAERWGGETAHLSSPSQMMMHPSYQAALGLAQDNKDAVVRLMLNDLRDNRRLWFWALSFLTKENPVRATEAGKMDLMISSWVRWGTQKGII